MLKCVTEESVPPFLSSHPTPSLAHLLACLSREIKTIVSTAFVAW